ncbi:MAG: hypothetical protein KBD21_03990 [Candidatus Pacebacteria bacterium]|nr:hypothetical protein [Candidatus Paceibacterota bacterium]
MDINAPTFNPFAGDTRTEGEISLRARVRAWVDQARDESRPLPQPAPAGWYWVAFEEYMFDAGLCARIEHGKMYAVRTPVSEG